MRPPRPCCRIDPAAIPLPRNAMGLSRWLRRRYDGNRLYVYQQQDSVWSFSLATPLLCRHAKGTASRRRTTVHGAAPCVMLSPRCSHGTPGARAYDVSVPCRLRHRHLRRACGADARIYGAFCQNLNLHEAALLCVRHTQLAQAHESLHIIRKITALHDRMMTAQRWLGVVTTMTTTVVSLAQLPPPAPLCPPRTPATVTQDFFFFHPTPAPGSSLSFANHDMAVSIIVYFCVRLTG